MLHVCTGDTYVPPLTCQQCRSETTNRPFAPLLQEKRLHALSSVLGSLLVHQFNLHQGFS